LIRIVPSGDPNALRCALKKALREAMGENEVARLTDAERQALSWKSYALRDLQFTAGTLGPCAHRTSFVSPRRPFHGTHDHP
jgi:hypothetical protein